MEKSIKSWGYVNQKDFRDPNLDKLSEKINNNEPLNDTIQLSAQLLKKLQDNESLLSFSE
jgi:hypothetical protein